MLRDKKRKAKESFDLTNHTNLSKGDTNYEIIIPLSKNTGNSKGCSPSSGSRKSRSPIR